MTLARPPADLRGQVSGEEGVSHHVHAAVEVQNNVARFDSVDRDLGGWDAAQCGCGHRHVGGQRLCRKQLSEQASLLVDIAAVGEGRLSQDCVEVLSLLGAHGGSPFVTDGRVSLQSRMRLRSAKHQRPSSLAKVSR